MAVCFVLFVVCLAVTPSTENNEQADNIEYTESEQIIASKEEESAQREEITDVIYYDKLQSLFLTFSFETTEDDLIKMIEENDLEYTAEKYNGSPKTIHYKIAYAHDTALQKYAESGDYVDVSFDMADGTFMYAEYFNNDAFKTALLYNYGTYYDFREDKGNNKYSGYYYYKPGEDEGGIAIEYDNGNSTETGYHSAENGEDALSGVLG